MKTSRFEKRIFFLLFFFVLITSGYSRSLPLHPFQSPEGERLIFENRGTVVAGDGWFALTTSQTTGAGTGSELVWQFISPDGLVGVPVSDPTPGRLVKLVSSAAVGDLLVTLSLSLHPENGLVYQITAVSHETSLPVWSHSLGSQFSWSGIADEELFLKIAGGRLFLIQPGPQTWQVGTPISRSLSTVSLSDGEIGESVIRSLFPESDLGWARDVTANSTELALTSHDGDEETINYYQLADLTFLRSVPSFISSRQNSSLVIPERLFLDGQVMYAVDPHLNHIIKVPTSGDLDVLDLSDIRDFPQLPFGIQMKAAFREENKMWLVSTFGLVKIDLDEMQFEEAHGIGHPKTYFPGAESHALTDGRLLANRTGGPVLIDLDPDKPTLAISVPEVPESDGVLNIDLTLDRPSDQSVSIDLSTISSSARAGSDFIPINGQRIVIPAGITSMTFAIEIVTDQVSELREEFSIELSNPQHVFSPVSKHRAVIKGSIFEVSIFGPTITPMPEVEVPGNLPRVIVNRFPEGISEIKVEEVFNTPDPFIVRLTKPAELDVLRFGANEDFLITWIEPGESTSVHPSHGKMRVYSISERTLVHQFDHPAIDTFSDLGRRGSGGVRFLKNHFVLTDSSEARSVFFYRLDDFTLETEIATDGLGEFVVGYTSAEFSKISTNDGTEVIDTILWHSPGEPIRITPPLSGFQGGRLINLSHRNTVSPVLQDNLLYYLVSQSSAVIRINLTTGEVISVGSIPATLNCPHKNLYVSGRLVVVENMGRIQIFDQNTKLLLQDIELFSGVREATNRDRGCFRQVDHGDHLEYVQDGMSYRLMLNELVPELAIESEEAGELLSDRVMILRHAEPFSGEIKYRGWITTDPGFRPRDFSPASEEDFENLQFTATMRAGQIEERVTLPIFDDRLPEQSEWFEIDLTRLEKLAARREFTLLNGTRFHPLEPAIFSPEEGLGLFGAEMAANSSRVFFSSVNQRAVAGRKLIQFTTHHSQSQLTDLVEETARNEAIFGAAIAVDEQFLAVSDLTAPNEVPRKSGVYVYRADTLGKVGFLTGGSEFGQFGLDLAIAHQQLIVGDPQLDLFPAETPTRAGFVDIYALPDLQFRKRLRAPFPKLGDEFGLVVEVTEDLIIVGSTGTGEVHLYENDTHDWIVTLTPDEMNSKRDFGREIAVNEEVLVISNAIGEIYCYDPVTHELRFVETGPNHHPSGDVYGEQLALTANVLAIGSQSGFPGAERPGFIDFVDLQGGLIERAVGQGEANRVGIAPFPLEIMSWDETFYVATSDFREPNLSVAGRVERYRLPRYFSAPSFLAENRFDIFPDGDLNLLDYAFSDRSVVKTGNGPSFTFPKAVPPDVVLMVEESTDLIEWKERVRGGQLNDGTSENEVGHRVFNPDFKGARRFYRWRVETANAPD